MPSAKQRANWARFARMARARGRKSRRKSVSTRRASPARRVYRKRSTMPRRKKTGRSRGRKTIHVLTTAAGVNAMYQLFKPILDAGLIAAVRSGDAAAIGAALGSGTKAAVQFQNLIEAFGPMAAVKAAKFAMGALGVPNPGVRRIKAF